MPVALALALVVRGYSVTLSLGNHGHGHGASGRGRSGGGGSAAGDAVTGWGLGPGFRLSESGLRRATVTEPRPQWYYLKPRLRLGVTPTQWQCSLTAYAGPVTEAQKLGPSNFNLSSTELNSHCHVVTLSVSRGRGYAIRGLIRSERSAIKT